jgi:hypothetical protein
MTLQTGGIRPKGRYIRVKPPGTQSMAIFEFSRWDGSSEFTLQSADELFDQLDQ